MTEQLDAGIIASQDQDELSTGTIVEETDTADVETVNEEVEETEEAETTEVEEVETEEAINQEANKKRKNAQKVKKILSEKNELKKRVELLERTTAIKDLQIKYGEVDEEAVTQLKEAHPSLSYEECLILHNSKNNKVIEPPKQNLGLVGRETANTDSNIITIAELSAISDPEEYARKHDLIKAGKIKLVNKK